MASNEHDLGVIEAKKEILKEGYTLDAAPETHGYEADAYGYIKDKEGKIIHEFLIEVETADSMGKDHAMKQMAAFKKWKDEEPEKRIIGLETPASGGMGTTITHVSYDRHFYFSAIK